MTNWDKNLEKIMEITRSGGLIAVDEKGILSICKHDCNKCIFCHVGTNCIPKRAAWFNTEINPYESWEVDKKILVSHDNYTWNKRHFAKYSNGKFYAWDDGITSYYAECDERYTTGWEYAKPYEEE